MTRGRGRHRDRDPMQVAAAVVGAAGAAQMLEVPESPAAEHGRHGHVCPGDCPDASQVLPQVAEAALDVHAALNTYEVAAGVPEQFGSLGQTAFVVGANGRKLIARWQDEGVWIGGCLITDRGVAERLAAFITREADE